ncbi:MAG TPA: HD domain-containing protein [Gemmataceae bacterium]|nr:HD domain-containing protein [Gemmataceae bacterium]
MKATSSFRQPEYLTNNDVPHHRIRCPVHGFIRYSENERKIIDHWIFRRLRHIRQLALTDLVYPGATHTRFEHCLGVMELASRAFDQLAATRGALLEWNLKKVAELNQEPLAIARQLVRLAGLLHDVGHACFSHAAETVIHEGGGHESFTFKLVEEKEFLGNELDKAYFAGFSGLLGKLLRGGAVMPPQLKVLKDLVSGEMDADRSDYLQRDSHHCGVEYGRFDHRRMVQCLDLHEADGGALEIALHRDGIHTFEALILARYQMNTQVYYHRIRRIYDYYLCQYFAEKGREAFDSADKILNQTDIQAMATILQEAEKGQGGHGKWAARIRDRNHHRVVHETGEDANAMDLKHSGKLLEKLRENFPEVDFIPDVASQSIHRLLLPEDTEATGLVALPLIESSGESHYLGSRSHILRRIPRRFQVARIFSDIARDNAELLRTIRSFALDEYRKLGGQS